MPRPWLFALTLVLLAGVAALFFWPISRLDSTEPIQSGPVHAQEPLLELDGAEAADTTDHSAETADSNRRKLAATNSTSTPKSNPVLPPYDGADGVVVLVLNDANDQPVMQADVYSLNPGDFSEAEIFAMGPATDRATIFRAFGKHYQSDELGQVLIPPLSKESFLYAEADGHSQIHSSETDNQGQIVIRLKAKIPFRVRVIDGAGKPVAGIPVALRQAIHTSSYPQSPGITDSEGFMAWPDLRKIMDRQQEGSTFSAGIEIPLNLNSGPTGTTAELTEEVLAAGEATLTLPPVGGVRVTIVNELGDVFLEAGRVSLYPATRPSDFYMEPGMTLNTTDGMAEFPLVGLNSPLKLSFLAKGLSNSDFLSFDGPQRAGEWIEIKLIHYLKPTLTGKLLGPSGTVLADQRITLQYFFKSESNRISRIQRRIQTDSDGRFQSEVPNPGFTTPFVERKISFNQELDGVGKCKVGVDIPLDLVPGLHDLGSLSLSPESLLLTGRVLDPQGVAIQYASVRVHATPAAAETRPRGIPSQGVRVGTDARGEFRLQGAIDEAPSYQVEIRASGFETLIQEIALGSTGMEFHLTQAGILLGTLLVAEGIDRDQLSLRILEGDKVKSISLKDLTNPTRLEFRTEETSNTPLIVEVRTHLEKLVYRSEAIYLPSGVETRPADLQPLDLRSTLQLISILARDHEGTTLDSMVWISVGDGWKGESGGADGARLIITEPIQKLFVQSEGYVGKLVENVASDQIVILEPTLQVTLQIPASLVQYRDATITAYARSVIRDRSNPFASSPKITDFDSSGRATLYADRTGEYEFFLPIRMGHEHNFNSGSLKLGKYKITGAGQMLELKVDMVELEQMIDKLTD
jgi:hypothetical protein